MRSWRVSAMCAQLPHRARFPGGRLGTLAETAPQWKMAKVHPNIVWAIETSGICLSTTTSVYDGRRPWATKNCHDTEHVTKRGPWTGLQTAALIRQSLPCLSSGSWFCPLIRLPALQHGNVGALNHVCICSKLQLYRRLCRSWNSSLHPRWLGVTATSFGLCLAFSVASLMSGTALTGVCLCFQSKTIVHSAPVLTHHFTSSVIPKARSACPKRILCDEFTCGCITVDCSSVNSSYHHNRLLHATEDPHSVGPLVFFLPALCSSCTKKKDLLPACQ